MGFEVIVWGGMFYVLFCVWIFLKMGGVGIFGDCWNCGFIDFMGENGLKGFGIFLWFWLIMLGDGVGFLGKCMGLYFIVILFCILILMDGIVCKDLIISFKNFIRNFKMCI